MYKSLLIANDGSELAQKAVNQGLALAKSLNAAVTFVIATPDWSATDMAHRAELGAAHPVEDYEKREDEWASRVLSQSEDAARKMGVSCTTVRAKDKQPADGIIETAKSRGSDLIVMSSHGRSGMERLLLGSVANKVLTYSPIPVLIIR